MAVVKFETMIGGTQILEAIGKLAKVEGGHGDEVKAGEKG